MSAACTETMRVPTVNPQTWLERHGDHLYRFALFRLRDRSVAEDMVQETLLAALKSRDSFACISKERTWLIGILKHKIADHFRRNSRDNWCQQADDDEFFNNDGSWRVEARPILWNVNPHSILERKNFEETLHVCLSQLPERLARVFILREIEGLSSDEICELLNITPSNLWVMLHRARLNLQRLIGLHWFRDTNVPHAQKLCKVLSLNPTT